MTFFTPKSDTSRRGSWFNVALLFASLGVAVAACGGDDTATVPPGSGGSAGGAGAAAAGSAGSGGSGTSAGGNAGTSGGGGGSDVTPDGGNAGGSAGGAPITKGRPGMDLVAGGLVSKSANFKLILTVGESPGGNGLAKSSLYQMRGGLISSTQH